MDAAADDEQEDDELRVYHTQGLTVSETRVFLDLPYRGAAGEAGIGRDTAADVLAMYQRRVEQFTAAKGSLLRARATQNDHGSIPPD